MSLRGYSSIRILKQKIYYTQNQQKQAYFQHFRKPKRSESPFFLVFLIAKDYSSQIVRILRNFMNQLEEGNELNIDFNKIGKIADKCRDVIPVAIQNIDTGDVILIAYTNEKAFRKAIDTRTLVLWSTSRNELWEKGRTSGETFNLIEAYVNCEQNSLLYKVRPKRDGICHTKNSKSKPRNCYYRRIVFDTQKLQNIDP